MGDEDTYTNGIKSSWVNGSYLVLLGLGSMNFNYFKTSTRKTPDSNLLLNGMERKKGLAKKR